MKVEISLSRAHKLIERMKSLAKQELEKVEIQTVVSNTFTSLSSLQEKQLKSELSLNLYQKLQFQQMKMKQQLAQYNSQRGIDSLLIELDFSNKRLAAFKEMLNKVDKAVCELSEYEQHIQAMKDNKKDYFALAVFSMSKEQREAIAQEVEELQKQVFRINDDISDKNATKAAFEIDEEIGKLIF